MECRVGCGACCIAPSINSPIPGMPQGKPAGGRCVQLTADNRCKLFGLPERPAFCVGLRPSEEMCGADAAEALQRLNRLERLTRPTDSSAIVELISAEAAPPVRS
jgi:uncharacterized protein